MSRPINRMSTRLNPETSVEEKWQLHEFVSRLVIQLESDIALDQHVLNSSLSGFVKSGGIRYWLLSFVDTFVERWNYCSKLSKSDRARLQALEKLGSNLSPSLRMSDHLRDSQTPEWSEALCREILNYWSENGRTDLSLPRRRELDQPNPVLVSDSRSTRHKVNLGRLFLSQTYLTRFSEIVLAITFGTFPSRWKEPVLKAKIRRDLRDQISLRVDEYTPGTLEHCIRTVLPKVIPQSVIEDFESLLAWACKRTRKPPAAILTANLHLSSDSFLVWAWRMRSQGSRLLLAQHGGLNGQGAIPTRVEEFEQFFADTYFHWGWSQHLGSKSIPVQPVVWKRSRQSSRRRSNLLMITDCTLRNSRYPWPIKHHNDTYRGMVLSTYSSLPSHIKKATVVRLHHDHDRYDESHRSMWEEICPANSIDNGLSSIEKLRTSARLVVCTTLGTSEIIQFARSIPTVLRLDSSIQPVRPECEDLFLRMARVGLVHTSNSSLNEFLLTNWDCIDSWWKSNEVQFEVSKYLHLYGNSQHYEFGLLRRAIRQALRTTDSR